jgi:hypothetical protein
MTTFSASVAAALDNGAEFVSSTFITSSTLVVGNVAAFTANSGIRFINVTVPQGATINSATITNYAQVVTGTCLALWYAWDTDNAGRFSFGGDLPSNVTKTTAFTAFTASNGDIAHDITSVVQEIVDRAGWASGNAINLIAFDNGSALNEGTEWDGFSTGTPGLLDIDYTEGAVGSGLIKGLKLERVSLV